MVPAQTKDSIGAKTVKIAFSAQTKCLVFNGAGQIPSKTSSLLIKDANKSKMHLILVKELDPFLEKAFAFPLVFTSLKRLLKVYLGYNLRIGQSPSKGALLKK